MASNRTTHRLAALVLLAFASCASAQAPAPLARAEFLRPAAAPAPADNLPTAARVNLGKTLFFDPRLSASNWISCATCHNPALGWSDGLPTGRGHGMQVLGRATPTLVNVAFNPVQMWDGRKTTLEDQALGPIEASVEMAQDIPGLVAKLRAIEGYRALFEAAYPGEGISGDTIAKALASYERTLLSTESPFDRWMKGDERAVDAAAKRGFEIFRGKAGCETCHSGFNFTDNGFHNIGLASDDPGRFAQRKVAVNQGAFKTPTLRDVALTAPYMHNGAYRTLEEVVDHYARRGDRRDNLSPNMKQYTLTPRERDDLVAFMKTLTGDPAPVSIPSLPR